MICLWSDTAGGRGAGSAGGGIRSPFSSDYRAGPSPLPSASLRLSLRHLPVLLPRRARHPGGYCRGMGSRGRGRVASGARSAVDPTCPGGRAQAGTELSEDLLTNLYSPSPGRKSRKYASRTIHTSGESYQRCCQRQEAQGASGPQIVYMCLCFILDQNMNTYEPVYSRRSVRSLQIRGL